MCKEEEQSRRETQGSRDLSERGDDGIRDGHTDGSKDNGKFFS